MDLEFPPPRREKECVGASGERGLTFAVFKPHMTCAVSTDVTKKETKPRALC